MLYATYQIHPETLNVSLLQVYKSYTLARSSFVNDVERCIVSSVNPGKRELNLTHIGRKQDILKSTSLPGYYLKTSQRFPDRLNLYEKVKVSVPGRIWGSYDEYKLVKHRVFSIMPINVEEEVTPIDISINERFHQSQTLKGHGGHVKYMEELKEKLERRRRCVDSL